MMNSLLPSLLLLICGMGTHCSIIRDSLECPRGYGPSIDGLNCVKKIILPSRKPCPMPLLRHGHVEVQLGGRMAKFWCEDGRSLVPSNASHAMCSAFGFWNKDIPNCVLTETGGCGELPEEDHLTATKVTEEEGVTVYGFECDPGFDLIGPFVISCNGFLWNGTLPGCQKRTTTTTTIPPVITEGILIEQQRDPQEIQFLPEESLMEMSTKPRRLSEYSVSFGLPSARSSLLLLILFKLLPLGLL